MDKKIRGERQDEGSKVNRRLGLLEEGEIEKQVKFWIRQAQRSAEWTDNLEKDRMQLNLQLNSEGLLECRGRILGQYPIYLPDCHAIIEKIVEEEHLRTLHGGIGATMNQVRERYWVPRLRRLARKVIKSCKGCRRFQAKAFAAPPPGIGNEFLLLEIILDVEVTLNNRPLSYVKLPILTPNSLLYG